MPINETIFRDETSDKIKRPSLFKVILLNDDYTTMDFVVYILMYVFNKTEQEANKLMIDVHEKGKAIVGMYTYDIAKTKASQVEELAKEKEFPLKVEIEKE